MATIATGFVSLPPIAADRSSRPHTDRRSSRRLRLYGYAAARLPGGEWLGCRSIDAGPSGFGFVSVEHRPVGTVLEFRLPRGGGRQWRIEIVWCEQSSAGYRVGARRCCVDEAGDAESGEMVRAASIAHELHQPLYAIRNFAEAAANRIRSGAATAQETIAQFRRIGELAERAGETVCRLRADVRRRAFHRPGVRIHVVLDQVLQLLESEIGRNGIALIRIAPQDEPAVPADAVQLHEVFFNLIGNAIDALCLVPPGRRTLTITTAAPSPDGVEIAFSDSGPGVSKAVAARLFEPFATTKPQGLGIGLSISRRIIEAHGGRLIHTNGDGGGAIFRVILPISDRGGPP